MLKYNHKRYKGIIFIMPSFIGVFIFSVMPLIDVIIRAFKSPVNKKWVGILNFKKVINNGAFRLAVFNTIKFVLVCIPLLIMLSLLIAVALQSKALIDNTIKKGFLLPMAIPVASVVFLWQMLFHRNGLLNRLFDMFDIESIDWMNSKYAFGVLVLSYIWKNIGYSIILWVVGLLSISKDMYDAAKVDGAGKWRTFISITLPNLRLTFYMVVILSLLNSFKVFREAYLVAGSYPEENIYMLQHLYNNWFLNMSLDKLTASSVLVGGIMLIIVLVLQKIWKERT